MNAGIRARVAFWLWRRTRLNAFKCDQVADCICYLAATLILVIAMAGALFYQIPGAAP